MSGRNGRYLAALGGLSAILLLGAAPVAKVGEPKGTPQATRAQSNTQNSSPDGLTPYERADLTHSAKANDIADAQRRYGLLQTILAGVGVAFTGIAAFFAWRATHWAKDAATHTKRSADADNAALKATLEAAAEARNDAKVSEERFREQMDKTQEMVEFTAKGSYAMEHSASANRSMAGHMHSTAQKQLRPYVYLVDEKCALTAAMGVLYKGEATFAFRNFGQTPAKRLRFRAIFELRAGPWNLDFPADLANVYELHFGDLPPGHTRGMEEGYVSQSLEQHQLALRDDGAALVLYGEVVYQDAEGTEYTTTFRRAANGPYQGTGVFPFHIPPEGNKAT